MIDFSPLEDALLTELVAAVEAGTVDIAELARQRAPVRRVFHGGKRFIRFKSVSEVESDRMLRASLGLGPERAAPEGLSGAARRSRFARTVEAYTPGANVYPGFRKLGRPRSTLAFRPAEARLTRRGRYELRHQRAHYRGYLGGRLRGEIHATPALVRGNMVTSSVISPTPYAKYQEMGTRHNPAHPYLRPAVAESRTRVVAGIRTAALAGTRAGLLNVRGVIPLTLELKVVV